MPANTIITVRKGSSSEWASANPVLASGELGFDTTNNILKIGNGTSDWNSLSNHRHSSADITNFNSSVSGLLPVKDIVASSGINIFSVSGIYTISSPEEVVEYLTAAQFPSSGNTSLLYIATDDSRVYRWTGFQYVEIGPTAFVPLSSGNFSTLQVNGTGVVASSGGNSGYLSKFTASNTIDDSIIYQSSGNIGINTTNPSYQLDVSGSIRTLRSDANEFLYYERPGVGNGGLAISASATTFRSSLPYRFIVGANEHVRIDSSGNVGIGTTTPSGKLHIGSGDLHFDSGYGLRWAGGSRLYEERFGVAGGSTERMLYLANGDRFEVLTENGVNFIAGFHGANSLLTNSIRLYRAVGIGSNYAASGSLPVNGLAVQGNVGIGVQSPIAPLHVIGSGVYSTSDSSSVITIDPSGRSIDCNPSAFSDIILKANNQSIFRGLDGWTGTWADAAITTYFQVGRNAGNTIFTSLQGAPFTRLAYSANKILFTNTGSNLSTPSGYFTIGSSIDGGSVGTSGLVIDTVHRSSSANGQSHGALVVTPLFNTVGSNLNNIYGAYIEPRHSGVYTTTNSYGLYVNAATNISGTITNNYAAVFNGGNVGINTTNPLQRLDVRGNVYASGSLGINNPAPSSVLDVIGESRIQGLLYFNQNSTDAGDSTRNACSIQRVNARNLTLTGGSNTIQLAGDGGKLILLSSTVGTEIGSSFANSYVMFNPGGGSEKARITPSGWLGIGTSTPNGQLHVVGTGIFDNSIRLGSSSTSGTIIGLSTTGTVPAIVFDTIGNNHGFNQTLYDFRENGTSLISIDGFGNLNAGAGNIIANATNPSVDNGAFGGHGMRRRLTSAGMEFAWGESITSVSEPGIDLFPIGGTHIGSGILFRLSKNSTKTDVAMLVNGSGNIGVGTNNPQYALDVIGTGNFSQNLLVNGTGVSLVGHTHTSSNITDFNSSVSGLLPTISNSGVNRLLTSTGSSVGIDAESNLTFDGSTLNVDGNLVFDSFTESVVAIGNSSTSQTLSLASGTVHTCTLTGNCTFTMPTATAGKSFTMFLNSGSGNYTASFSGVLWSDSAPPTITTAASKVDILSFISDGTYWYGSYSQNYG